MAAATRRRPAKWLPLGVLLVVLSVSVAWSLRVAFLGYDGLSDLTLAGVANEALRAVIFAGPVLLYLRSVEKAGARASSGSSRPPGRPVGPAGHAAGSPVPGRTLN